MTAVATTERPILFSGAMVQAILRGQKSVTRRVVKPQPPAGWDRHAWMNAPTYGWTNQPIPALLWHEVRCPYGQPGDRIWVREGFRVQSALDLPLGVAQPVAYDADGLTACLEDYRRRPSIHMPRWASRLTLEITDIRVERVQAISESDALAEGVGSVEEFRALWDGINGKRGFGWESNVWVWVVEFRRVEQP